MITIGTCRWKGTVFLEKTSPLDKYITRTDNILYEVISNETSSILKDINTHCKWTTCVSNEDISHAYVYWYVRYEYRRTKRCSGS